MPRLAKAASSDKSEGSIPVSLVIIASTLAAVPSGTRDAGPSAADFVSGAGARA